MSLFEETFEDGTYDAWDGKSGGDILTIVTTDPYDGSYHANAYCNGGASGESTYLTKTVANSSTLYSRAYFKLKTNLPASSEIFILMTHFVGSTNINLVRIQNTGGVIKWNLYYLSSGESWSSVLSSETVALDTWYCVELKSVIHDSAGECTLYVNGNAVCNVSGLDNNFYAAHINAVRMGEIYSSGTTAHSTYFDSVIIDTSYIGTEAGGGGDPGIGTYFEPMKLASDPSTGGWGTDEAGIWWYNTTTNVYKYWNGSAIKTMASTTV